MKKWLIALLVASGLVFSGCGGGSDGGETAESPSAESPSAENPAADSPAAQTKTYYDIPMYREVDSSFATKLTTGVFTVHEKYDDYYKINVVSTPEQGALKVILTKTFINDEYGTDAKAGFDALAKSLGAKYSIGEYDYDFCSGSSYVCQSDNYAYSLYREERFKVKSYVNGEDTIVLQLDASSRSIYDIDLKVTYETKEFSEAVDEYEQAEIDGMTEGL